MRKKIVVYIQFNDDDINLRGNYKWDPLTREWIRNRLVLFNKYTRASLESQTNQDFIALLRIHPSSHAIINEELSYYPKLNPNIIFTSEPRKIIRDYISDTDLLYLCQIDSDDLYRNDYIQLLANHEWDGKKAGILSRKGFGYQEATKRWYYTDYFSPHFFTQIFKKQEYLEFYQYMPELVHITFAFFPVDFMPGNTYIRIEHATNTSRTDINGEFLLEASYLGIKEYLRQNFAFYGE